jgi:hypothetical protein
VNKLETIIFERVLEILRRERDNPEVGMGMLFDTAIDLAVNSLTREAAKWGARMPTTGYNRETIRDNIYAHVSKPCTPPGSW